MDVTQLVQTLAIYSLPVLFAITLHEAAHGYVARHFGDMTAHAQGRISLNPARHVDLIGTLLVPLIILFLTQGKFLFGWAKPVPVNYSALRKPRQHRIFNVPDRTGLAAVLSGRAGPGAVTAVPQLGTLSILPAGLALWGSLMMFGAGGGATFLAGMVLGLLLFALPVIVMAGYAVVVQAAVLETLRSSTDALGRSWALTRGHRGKVVLLWIVIGVLFGAVVAGVSIIWGAPGQPGGGAGERERGDCKQCFDALHAEFLVEWKGTRSLGTACKRSVSAP